MRLYVTTRGSWAGTQDDAKALAKTEGSTWAHQDVPTDKAPLLAFLNEHKVGRTDASQDVGGPGPVAVAKVHEVAPAIPSRPAAPQPENDPVRTLQRHAVDVEEEIGRADLPRTIRLCEHVHWRLEEHLRAAREALQ